MIFAVNNFKYKQLKVNDLSSYEFASIKLEAD